LIAGRRKMETSLLEDYKRMDYLSTKPLAMKLSINRTVACLMCVSALGLFLPACTKSNVAPKSDLTSPQSINRSTINASTTAGTSGGSTNPSGLTEWTPTTKLSAAGTRYHSKESN
jgi:hypothetical protein